MGSWGLLPRETCVFRTGLCPVELQPHCLENARGDGVEHACKDPRGGLSREGRQNTLV